MKFMQKINLISQVYTIIRSFNEKIKEIKKKGDSIEKKKNLIFIIIMKLQYSLKNGSIMQNNEDLDVFFQSLR